MFNIEETGPKIDGNKVQFRIYLPSIDRDHGFSVKAYVINKKDQFNPDIQAAVYNLYQEPDNLSAGNSGPENNHWGDILKNRWISEPIQLNPGIYLYRFEITGPVRNNNAEHIADDTNSANDNAGSTVRSLYFGDPCARETDVGIFSVFRIPEKEEPSWQDENFKVAPLDEIILYELNVAEFGGTFEGVADRIPYLLSLGINTIELLPINSIAEPTRWGYMPMFYLAPEERFGGPAGLKHLVQECHRNGIAVILDMVYAHTDRMFPYQIGYERFFDLWRDNQFEEPDGTKHFSPNPMVSDYNNYGNKNDWRMRSTVEFFTAVNAFWMKEYHIDGFRYDHVNGFLDRKPIEESGKIDWYSHENRPTFKSLQELSTATYRESKQYPRFSAGNQDSSRIIQIAEDLSESAYQLSAISNSAINGCWEKRLADAAKNMAISGCMDAELGKALVLESKNFDNNNYSGYKSVDSDTMQALPVQYIESHDECRLFYLIQNRRNSEGSGYDYRHGLDDQPWWKLQPYAIALLTCVGIPMIWAGQEFAENTDLSIGGLVRVRGFRPLHWDYFYNAASSPDNATVLPLTTLYRKLGHLRKDVPALRANRDKAKIENIDADKKMLVYRRWSNGNTDTINNDICIVALNFSDSDQMIPIPFGHAGEWIDILDSSFVGPENAYSLHVNDPTSHEFSPIPSNFGRIFRLKFL